MGTEAHQELQNGASEQQRSAIALKGVLVLQLNPDGRDNIRVELAAPPGYVLGRSDAKSSFNPDIDMAAFNAHDKGVSRRHAAFVAHNNALALLDLSSVNGTFVNGLRLAAEVPAALHDGDTITLGELSFKISVI